MSVVSVPFSPSIDDVSKVTLFVHFQAGQGKKGTDKAVFVEILTTRNYAQLRATFDAYKSVSIETVSFEYFTLY